MKFKVGDREYEVRQVGQTHYYISKCGELITTKFGFPRILPGSLIGGYRGATLCYEGFRDLTRHHHLVMRWWVGPRPEGMVINHKDGVKINNRLENLEYCTPKENREHAKLHRLYHSGDRHAGSKLSNEAVELLKRAYAVGMSLNQLARAFEVDKKAISQVLNGTTWRYAEEDLKAKREGAKNAKQK